MLKAYPFLRIVSGFSQNVDPSLLMEEVRYMPFIPQIYRTEIGRTKER
jgi:hypothetical protein